MSELNYDRIAAILGGIVTDIKAPTFGGISAVGVATERFRSLNETYRRIHLSPTETKKIARAFEETRDGYEVDRVLIDPQLSIAFINRCRDFGITACPALINKRIQLIRKARPFGIGLKAATKPSAIDGERYKYVAELAFSQLTYRPDTSEDDVITDPKVGDEFLQIAAAIDPKAPAIAVKWALVSLRKARGSLNEDRIKKILMLQPRLIEDKFSDAGNLRHLHVQQIPEEEGIITLHEESKRQDRYLYLASSKNLKEDAEPFLGGQPFKAIANPFWKPKPDEIHLGYAVIKRKPKRPTARDWYFRLVYEWHPIFNIPVDLKDRIAA